MKKCAYLFFSLISLDLFAQETINTRQDHVENGLTPILRYSDQPTWNILERQAMYNVPGVTVAVIDNFEVDWAQAYGISDDSKGTQATTKTAFQAASISKTVNALGVLIWAEKNDVDLDSDVNTLLKGWQVGSEKPITLYQLLTHTAGLSVHGFPGYTSDKNLPTTIQILNGEKPANNKKVKPIMPPGQSFKYSGGGTTITQLLLEEQVGDYASYMKRTFFDPLGMDHTFYPSQITGSVSMSHDHKGKSRKNGYNVYPELGAAALWTTPTDLAKLIIEIQKALNGESEIISQEVATTFTTPWKEGQTNAPGTFIDNEGSIRYFQHSGGNEGFNCLYYASMEKGHGAIVMINAEKFDLIHEIMRGIAETYGWETYLPTVTTRSEIPSKAELATYEGTYRSVDAPEKSVSVFEKKGKLYVEQKKRWTSELIPKGKNAFITKDIQPTATLLFENDQVIIQQGEDGQKYIWKKD